MRYLIPSLAILLFFSSCSGNSKSELAVFEATTKSLDQSSKAISSITADNRKQLFDRLHDLRTTEMAKIWQPKAVKVSELVLSTIGYINSLKSQLNNKSENFNVVNKVFFQQNKGAELYRQLRNFVGTINAIDPRFGKDFFESTDRFNYLDSTQYGEKKFANTFFSNVSVAAALSMLAKIENDILNTENEIISYCYYHTDSRGCGMDYLYPFMSISSRCVKVGDDIEITAAIGSISFTSQPKIKIDGKIISADFGSAAVHKFKAPQQAGEYSVPVKLEYTKPDGTTESVERNIQYTVVDPDKK